MERFIVLLYSCHVDRNKWWIYVRTRSSIRQTLELGPEWEHPLLDATFLSAFQIAIPLMPGISKLDYRQCFEGAGGTRPREVHKLSTLESISDCER